MASENLSDKKVAEQLARAFMHLSGFSGFRRLNALTEVALENSVIGEIDWEKIVAEGNRKLTAAPKALSVLKKEKKFYKDLQDFLGKPGKTIDDEMTRYLNMISSPLPRKATSSGYQYALGADTGASNDFAYLRREERRQAELNRFLTMMDRDIQSSSLIGDDNQYALGADTGVRDDFAYLRKEERRQAERNRFRTMMSRDIRSSLSVGDDDQYAFGADTGVRDDFAYLHEEERQQNIRNSRRSVRSRRQRANLMRLNMDEYDLFIHDNREAYGGRVGADAAFRQKLLKELPPFLKNTNLSTKTLISIDKAIKSARGIPLIGKLMHPATLGLAALGIADAVLSTSNASNKTVTAWSASRALTGSPSRRFDSMARLAGAKDEQEVLKMYGSLLEKFGTEDAFDMMGYALRSAPPGIQRLFVARSLGIDEKQANALMYLAGEAPLESTSEAQSTAAKYSRLGDIESWGFRSGSSLVEKMRSASLGLPMEKSLEARGTSWLDILEAAIPTMWGDLIMRKTLGSPTDDIDEMIKRDMENTNAAESLDEAERQGDTTMNSNVRNSAIYITNMNVQTNDPRAFSEALDGMANGDNRGLLATSGNYVLA